MKTNINKDYELSFNFILKNYTNLSEDELSLVLDWRNDEQIRKWMIRHNTIPLDEHKKFISTLSESDKNGYWLVIFEDKKIGSISLSNLDFDNKRCITGAFVNPEYLNRGKGFILMNCLLELAFDKLDLHCVRGETREDNNNMRRLFQYLGYTHEGFFRDYVFDSYEKEYINVHLYSMLSSEWRSKKSKIESSTKKVLALL